MTKIDYKIYQSSLYQITMIQKPILKWVGGKTQIIENVMARFPKQINNYHEPFLGGGSVLLALLSHQKQGLITISGQVFASDLNINLISLYKNIQSDPQMFIQEMTTLVNAYKSITNEAVEPNRKPTTMDEAMTSQESYYYWIRSQFNKLPPDLRSSHQASAMFLFLNKTCFRGLYREGPNGFNVPFGHYKNPSIIEIEQILAVSALIQNVVFRCSSFSDSLVCQKDDFVYMDPPYVPINATSFVGYNVDGFDSSKHEELFGLCKELKKNNVKMMLSNADVPLVRAAFSEYTTDIVSCRRAINSKNPESRTNEVLIVNY